MDPKPEIGIVVAVREELRAVSLLLTAPCFHAPGGGSRQEFLSGSLGGHRVVVGRSGMGAARAYSLTESLIERFSPELLIVAGFAAGLTKEAAPGDIVIASKVEQAPAAPVKAAGKGGATSQALDPVPEPIRIVADPSVLTAARRVRIKGVRVLEGGVLTAAGVAQTRHEKRAAAEQAPGAIAVDMESAGAAVAAGAAGIPLMVVRAISDGVDDDLPLAFDRYTGADGEINRAMVAASVLLRPWKLLSFLHLAFRSSRAAHHLAAFLEAFLSEYRAETEAIP
jgi:adenosylhomocysteine nucleosidase